MQAGVVRLDRLIAALVARSEPVPKSAAGPDAISPPPSAATCRSTSCPMASSVPGRTMMVALTGERWLRIAARVTDVWLEEPA